MSNQSKGPFKSIGELARDLGLIDENSKKPKTHVIRFWEKKFKILKPSVVINKHRYYNDADFQIFKRVKYLLKDKGMTINGANNLIMSEYSVDYKKMNNISANNKLTKLKQIIKDIKKIL